jgi:ribonuclease D
MRANGTLRAISREAMLDLPIGRYEGDVCLVSTQHHLEHARADLAQERVIGFDTETRPAFRKGESYPPCLFQAATSRTVYLFQLYRTNAFPLLTELLADPRSVKAGVAVADDLRTLKHVFPFVEKSVVDLGIVARHAGYTQTGLRNLAGIFMGMRITKGIKTSNWAAPHLSTQQITYAATDAWVCRELYLRFQKEGLLRGGEPD